MIRIRIDGEPIPAARPRFSGRHCYQPKRNREYRAVVQQAARLAMGGREPLSGEVSATVKLYRRFKPTARIFGDVDNHLKAIFDGLNQIVFADDAQITKCVVEKFTDKVQPRAEIEIETTATKNTKYLFFRTLTAEIIARKDIFSKIFQRPNFMS